jgi:uncharacterized protein
MHLHARVGPLLESLGSSDNVDGTLDVGTLSMGECVFEPLAPARVHVVLTNTGAGIVATGSATARVRTSCVRCLRDFEMDVTAEVEGFYVLPGRGDGLPDEQEVEYVTGDRVDLGPAIVQAIVVELPFAPVHAEECAGLCPVCGADLNDTPCTCESQDEGSPFATLRGMVEHPAGGGER